MPAHNPGAMRMKDRVVIVTGAGSGIGRATAVRLALEGGRLLCADAKRDAAQETVDMIAGTGGEAAALLFDVTDEASCARMVEAVLGRFGRITSLVDSAGVSAAGRDATPAQGEWDRLVGGSLSPAAPGAASPWPLPQTRGHRRRHPVSYERRGIIRDRCRGAGGWRLRGGLTRALTGGQ